MKSVKMLVSFALLVVANLSSAAHGQTSANEGDWEKAAGGHQEFEVAAIHLGKPGEFQAPLFPLSPDDTYRDTHGRFFADFPLSVYVEFAYKLLRTESSHALIASEVGNDK
jgi:hypothetical protein